MIWSVSHVSGTFGSNSSGRLRGNSPWSPTVGMLMASTTTAAVVRTMDTSGAGITVVSFGMTYINSSPAATNGYTNQGTPIRCGSCATKIRMARALTKPTMTLRGMNRIILATPSSARTTWKMPARMTVAMK